MAAKRANCVLKVEPKFLFPLFKSSLYLNNYNFRILLETP